MIFVDTGAFLARYLTNDQYHALAVSTWAMIERNKELFCTSNFVIDELATLLARRSSYFFAAQKIHSLYESEIIDILRPGETEELKATKLLAKYSDQEVSFTDCTSFVLMKDRGIHRAFAFDRHFDLPGFTRIPLLS